MIMTKTASKAIKSAALAASEALIGNDDAAITAGTTAGRLAFRAGLTCKDMAHEVPALMAAVASPAWASLVDAWYDAQECVA